MTSALKMTFDLTLGRLKYGAFRQRADSGVSWPDCL